MDSTFDVGRQGELKGGSRALGLRKCASVVVDKTYKDASFMFIGFMWKVVCFNVECDVHC